MLTPARLLLTRRSAIATALGLAATVSRGNSAAAQTSLDDLPDAATVLTQIMPASAPNLKFTNAAGAPKTLADYPGHGLVINIWATWCGPCVAELPSFAAIAPHLAADNILVLPISVDLSGAPTVQNFYATHHIQNLPVLLDPQSNTTDTLNAEGIPVTIIINQVGQLTARIDGAANWNTTASINLIRRLAGPPAGVTPS